MPDAGRRILGGLRRGLVCGALAAALAVTSSPAGAETDADLETCAARTAAAVQRRFENVRDLSARFVQSQPAGGPTTAGDAGRSTGRVILAVPGRMRWTYDPPDATLMVSDGETLWLFDPEFKEAQRLVVRDSDFLSGAGLQFLLGRGDLVKEFEIRARSCSEEVAELELIPRTPASYERLRVRAHPERGDVTRTEVVDLLGRVTVMEFSEVETNQKPPPETFRFVPPAGVDVIDATP